MTLPMFLAKTEGAGLVTVQDLGRIAPERYCTHQELDGTLRQTMGRLLEGRATLAGSR